MVKLDTVMDFGLGPFISQVLAVTLIIFIIYLMYRILKGLKLIEKYDLQQTEKKNNTREELGVSLRFELLIL